MKHRLPGYTSQRSGRRRRAARGTASDGRKSGRRSSATANAITEVRDCAKINVINDRHRIDT